MFFQPCLAPAAKEGPAGAPGGEGEAAGQERGGTAGTNVRIFYLQIDEALIYLFYITKLWLF